MDAPYRAADKPVFLRRLIIFQSFNRINGPHFTILSYPFPIYNVSFDLTFIPVSCAGYHKYFELINIFVQIDKINQYIM